MWMKLYSWTKKVTWIEFTTQMQLTIWIKCIKWMDKFHQNGWTWFKKLPMLKMAEIDMDKIYIHRWHDHFQIGCISSNNIWVVNFTHEYNLIGFLWLFSISIEPFCISSMTHPTTQNQWRLTKTLLARDVGFWTSLMCLWIFLLVSNL